MPVSPPRTVLLHSRVARRSTFRIRTPATWFSGSDRPTCFRHRPMRRRAISSTTALDTIAHLIDTPFAIRGTMRRLLRGACAMTPDSARNIEFVGHSDLNGRGDGVQIMVHKGHAFIGYMFSDGFTVTDVRDPRHPKPVNFTPAPPNSRAFHLQR